MKKNEVLKKVGEKMAEACVIAPCVPLFFHQPPMPAKLQEKMKKSK